jgi:pre-rRNA-processing protein TSR1
MPSNVTAQTRLNRRNNAKQIQSQKRQALLASTRLFHGPNGVPRIVTIVSLTEDVNVCAVETSLAASLDIPAEECPQSGIWTIRYGLRDL